MRLRWTSWLSPCPRSLLTGSQNAVRVLVLAWQTGWWGGGRRCSCAEDRDDGRGRPCALQRQVPAVLRVRSGRASTSVRLQRV